MNEWNIHVTQRGGQQQPVLNQIENENQNGEGGRTKGEEEMGREEEKEEEN